jgi:hypothetical protein
MSVIRSTTGHNPAKEKSVARILYIFIVFAVLIGIGTALFLGRTNRSLDPQRSDTPQQVAPDQAPPATTEPAAPAEAPVH